MGIKVAKGRLLLIHYECDICKGSLVTEIDRRIEKDDSGDFHTIHTYQCLKCSNIEELEDIQYPYSITVQDEPYRDPDPQELTILGASR